MRKFPWSVLCLAAYPVLALFEHNRSEQLPSTMLLPLLVSVAAAWFLWRFLAWIVRDATRATLVASLAIVLFFSYGHVFSLVVNKSLGGFVYGRQRYWLALWLLLFVAGGWRLLTSRRRLDGLSRGVGIASALLVVVLAVRIGWYEAAERVRIPELNATDDPEWTERRAVQPASDGRRRGAAKPDIYYFVFDRYANTRALDLAYDFDNRPFLDALRERGFYVADDSRCNYASTFVSLASTLNLTHLDAVQAAAAASSDRTVVYRMLEDYRVQRYLRSEGYRYYHLGSWWEPTRKNRLADENVVFGARFSEFTLNLLQTTLAAPFTSGRIDRRIVQRGRVLHKFAQMQRIAAEPGPKFVFMHMLIPHDPYVFEADGSMVSADVLARRDERGNYINQLLFTNSQILAMIDHILAVSSRPPVILLLADEGLKLPHVDGHRNVIEHDTVIMRMGILNAVLLPGYAGDDLSPTMTPVNLFRVVFNTYFGTRYPRLADRIYWFEDVNQPYRFVDVTDLY